MTTDVPRSGFAAFAGIWVKALINLLSPPASFNIIVGNIVGVETALLLTILTRPPKVVVRSRIKRSMDQKLGTGGPLS